MTERQFLYTTIHPFPVGMPIVNIRLFHHEREITVPALVDSGAALNILPYDYGLELGFNWGEQRHQLPTGGLLQGAEAYAVLIKCIIGSFTPIDLAFAWVDKPSNELRALLGQINFFNHFRVIFEAYNGIFKIEPIEPGSMDGNPSFGLDDTIFDRS